MLGPTLCAHSCLGCDAHNFCPALAGPTKLWSWLENWSQNESLPTFVISDKNLAKKNWSKFAGGKAVKASSSWEPFHHQKIHMDTYSASIRICRKWLENASSPHNQGITDTARRPPYPCPILWDTGYGGIRVSRSILKFWFKKKYFNTGYNSKYSPIHFVIRCAVVGRQKLGPFLLRSDSTPSR
jgi:hypothetical protein